MEANERHKMAEERYRETLRMVEQQEEEIRRQLVVVKETIDKPTGQLPVASPLAFWAQPFSEEID
ncbi:hypothetical protein CR513_53452, partial [Mucuna pruriens]